MSTSIEGQKDRTGGSAPPTQLSWIRLLRNVVLGELVLAVFYVAIGSADVGIPIAVLVLPALLWLRRQSRAAAICSGSACGFIGLVVLVAFGNLFELAYPTSWPTFISAASLLVLTVLVIAAVVGFIRRGSSASGAPRCLARRPRPRPRPAPASMHERRSVQLRVRGLASRHRRPSGPSGAPDRP